jgi:hypothetical protein
LAQLAAEFEAERTALADLRRAHVELEGRWHAERAATAELQQAVSHAEARSQSGAQEVRDALAHSRAEVQTLRDDLEGARARVEALSGERADADRLWKESESRLKRATRERDELAEKLDAMRIPAEAAAKSVPSHTPLTVLPHPASKAPHRPQTKTTPKLKEEPEAGWVAVRMAARYGFDSPISVQVNGNPSQLCDLSVGGCQVLSLTPLKPNQAIKVLLPAEPKPTMCTGKIVWAKLEAPALGRPAGYRAGVQFTRPDEAAIEAFIARQPASVLA